MTLTDHFVKSPSEFSSRNRFSVLGLLFLGSVLILFPGIGEITGVTAKDEYFLIYRTALTMMERNEWLVPYLDGAPRIRKPPMVSWLTRASFELLGASVTSARLVSVFFSGLFVLVVALIGFEYTGNFNYALSAGLIALSTGGVAVQSRFLMLDIPTVTFGGFAIYWFLIWCKSQHPLLLVATAVSLSFGVLTKGPVAVVLFGAGVTALVLTNQEIKSTFRNGKKALFASLLLFLGLSLPWFAYVYWKYPDYTSVSLQLELAARQIGHFTFQPLGAAAALSLPWTFLLISSLSASKAASVVQAELPFRRVRTFLILWGGFSLVPFFFLKFSERYILGSVIPISLLCATAFLNGSKHVRPCSRLGVFATSVPVLAAIGFSWWFKASLSELILAGVSYLIFAVVWWRSAGILPMAISASLLWTAVVGFLYPTFGANAIPARVVERVRGERVFLYGEAPAAFLPVLLGRSLEQVDRIDSTHFLMGQRCPWIFVGEQVLPNWKKNLRSLGVVLKPVNSYKTLGQIEDLLKSALRGETRSQWILAFRSRSLEPVKETIFLYRVQIPGMCETNSTNPQRSELL